MPDLRAMPVGGKIPLAKNLNRKKGRQILSWMAGQPVTVINGQ